MQQHPADHRLAIIGRRRLPVGQRSIKARCPPGVQQALGSNRERPAGRAHKGADLHLPGRIHRRRRNPHPIGRAPVHRLPLDGERSPNASQRHVSIKPIGLPALPAAQIGQPHHAIGQPRIGDRHIGDRRRLRQRDRRLQLPVFINDQIEFRPGQPQLGDGKPITQEIHE